MLVHVAMFRAAAEAQDADILKMYNTRGSLVSIGPSLPANTPDTRYKLEVVSPCTSYNTVTTPGNTVST